MVINDETLQLMDHLELHQSTLGFFANQIMVDASAEEFFTSGKSAAMDAVRNTFGAILQEDSE